ncbi:MAG TPA: MFS transporter [Rhodospirillaceae bacterium]|nr:MFS transporter [Rhodospirillaceae bacterium]
MAAGDMAELEARYGPGFRWLVAAAGVTGTISMVLSATIVNVAVPSAMGAYGVGQDQAQWMATAFIATMVASQLLAAWFINALGERMTYTVIAVMFLFGSWLCYLSPTLDVLIIGRIIQGVPAGIIQPLMMSVIYRAFPPDKRGLAMGVYSTGLMISPMLGPVAGGYCIDEMSWRHIFLFPLPFCAVALFLGFFFLPGGWRLRRLPRFDWSSYILLVSTVFLLLTALSNGQRYGWGSDYILILFMFAFLLGTWYVRIQLRSESPLLDFSLFNNAQFSSAVIVYFVFGMGNFASNYIIPVFVQEVQHFSATLSGLVLLPAGIMVVCLVSFMGRLADTISPHYMVMVGLGMFALGSLLMNGSDVNTAFWTFAIFVMINRFGMSMILPALNTAALRALSPDELNKGSGTMNFLRQLGGAFGVSGLVVAMEQRTQFHAEALVATQTPGNTISRDLLDQVGHLLGEFGVPESIRGPGALHYLGDVVTAQASTLGFKDGFLIISAVYIVAMVPAWILGRAKPPAPAKATSEAA